MRCKTCGYTLSDKLVQNKCPYCAYRRIQDAREATVQKDCGGSRVKVTLPKQRVITPTYNSKGKLK